MHLTEPGTDFTNYLLSFITPRAEKNPQQRVALCMFFLLLPHRSTLKVRESFINIFGKEVICIKRARRYL